MQSAHDSGWVQGAMDIDSSDDSEDGPQKFRSLQDVYQDTTEVQVKLFMV